jgi:hypothetical protein
MTTQTFVLAVHLLGCAFGIGASTILDLRVLQLLSGRRVSTEDVVFAQRLVDLRRCRLSSIEMGSHRCSLSI